jgi:putative hydrolase of the HAD superfamily
MARDLGADPATFARAVSTSFDERVLGRLGTLEETIATLAHRVGISPSAAAVAVAARRRLEFTLGALQAEPRTLAVLDDLRAAGLRLGLISDCSIETPTLWPQSPLAARIEVTAFSCLLGMRKPQSKIYLGVARELAVQPGECLYVGDGDSSELTGAQAVGMRAVRLLRRDSPAMPQTRDPDFTGQAIAHLAELLPLLGVPTRAR